jgi:hypothetical protein
MLSWSVLATAAMVVAGVMHLAGGCSIKAFLSVCYLSNAVHSVPNLAVP